MICFLFYFKLENMQLNAEKQIRQQESEQFEFTK
jgi:uncharacterized membrane protein YciS (DUF1049 family)